MFTHKITYTDFNGQERTEDFNFHLNLPEVTRLEAEIKKPLEQHVQELAAAGEVEPLLTFLEKIVLDSYGKKTTDGRAFIKNKEVREEFEYSQAYAEFFHQLLTTPELARKFGELVADNGKARKNTVAPTVVQQ